MCTAYYQLENLLLYIVCLKQRAEPHFSVFFRSVLMKFLTANMYLYSEAHIIYGDYAHDLWKPDLVTGVLSKMTPDNMRVDLLLHHFDRTASGNDFNQLNNSS